MIICHFSEIDASQVTFRGPSKTFFGTQICSSFVNFGQWTPEVQMRKMRSVLLYTIVRKQMKYKLKKGLFRLPTVLPEFARETSNKATGNKPKRSNLALKKKHLISNHLKNTVTCTVILHFSLLICWFYST